MSELYSWGDMGKAEYLAEKQALQAQLAKLSVHQDKPDHLGKVAQYLDNLALAWQAASQERKNQLAAEIFEAVWIKDGLVQAVTPKPEMVPFFDLIYAETAKSNLQWRLRREAKSHLQGSYPLSALIPDWLPPTPTSRRVIRPSMVSDIRNARSRGNSLRDLSKEFGVSYETIRSASTMGTEA